VEENRLMVAVRGCRVRGMGKGEREEGCVEGVKGQRVL
jgi:hypothetical protein